MKEFLTSNSKSEKLASTCSFPGTHVTCICTVCQKLTISMKMIRLARILVVVRATLSISSTLPVPNERGDNPSVTDMKKMLSAVVGPAHYPALFA